MGSKFPDVNDPVPCQEKGCNGLCYFTNGELICCKCSIRNYNAEKEYNRGNRK